MKKIDLKRKTAVITGGSKGIGFAIAKRIAMEGVNVALCGRDQKSLKRAEKKLNSYQVKVFTYQTDLTKPASPKEFIKSVIKEFNGFDILINNAGCAIAKSFTKTSMEDWDNMMALNARAPYFLIKESIPILKKSKLGTIINIGSVVATKGYINQSAYAASKHALLGFTKAIAKEVQKYKIRVHFISMGGVATEMVKKTRPDLNIKELITPEEIADTLIFLLKNCGNGVIDEINIRRETKIPWV